MRDARRLVLKCGTKVLCEAGGELDLNYIRALTGQLAEAMHEGRQAVLVTSGAVRTGMGKLGLSRCRDLRLQQAAAAVGQPELMRMYADFFRDHGVTVAQVLLTRSDVAARQRYLNARNTLAELLAQGVLPIVNENDTVAVEEIQFGENDRLAAQVVQLVGADTLVFFTDTDGFYLPTGPDTAELLGEVDEITDAMMQAAGGSESGVGSGGMNTKLEAARMAMRVGARVVICRGKPPDGPPLRALLAGETRGTRFVPSARALRGRKRWLAQSAAPEGELVIDQGAVEAVTEGGKSLLAVGIVEQRGSYEPGALVRVLDRAGHEIARGLSNYSGAETARIQGLRSWDLAARLGYDGGAEVIHCDNLALTGGREGDEP